jgi:hypothetical protein
MLQIAIQAFDRPDEEGGRFFCVVLATAKTGLDLYSGFLETESEARRIQSEWQEVLNELTYAKRGPDNGAGIALVGSAEEWRDALKSEAFRARLKS